jgi:hypothetical protein
MEFDSTWRSIHEEVASLDRDAVLVTPGEDRVFTVAAVGEEAILVRFRDDGRRSLERDEFVRLAENLDGDGLELATLPPGVGPYVAVLTLAPQVTLASGHVRWRAGAGIEDGPSESPFRKSLWDVRRTPEKIHDDALLLAELLKRLDGTPIEAANPDALVDLYVLLSDVQRGSDDLRRDVGDELLEFVGPGGRLHGRYGSVSRSRRERRALKDEAEVFARLDEAGIPREWVTGIDEDKLDLVVTTTEVEEGDVYDVEADYYVQKTGVETDAKRSRLQGLKDRLPTLPDEEAADLREEIDDLEERIDDVLTA